MCLYCHVCLYQAYLRRYNILHSPFRWVYMYCHFWPLDEAPRRVVRFWDEISENQKRSNYHNDSPRDRGGARNMSCTESCPKDVHWSGHLEVKTAGKVCMAFWISKLTAGGCRRLTPFRTQLGPSFQPSPINASVLHNQNQPKKSSTQHDIDSQLHWGHHGPFWWMKLEGQNLTSPHSDNPPVGSWHLNMNRLWDFKKKNPSVT